MIDEPYTSQLLARARAGEQAALQRLLLHHHAPLAAFLARRIPAHLRATIDPEDVLQETYVCVFREIGAFRPQSPRALQHWLFRIAEHRLFDEIRTAHAAKRGGQCRRIEARDQVRSGSVAEWLEQLALHEHTPSQSVWAREAVSTIRSALEALPPDYRQALQLRYLDGLSVAQTADRMQRTQGAVCLLCHRALKKMHAALGSSTEFLGLRA